MKQRILFLCSLACVMGLVAVPATARGIWYWLTFQIVRTQAIRDVSGAVIPQVQAVYTRDTWNHETICTRILMRGDDVLSEVIVPTSFCSPAGQ